MFIFIFMFIVVYIICIYIYIYICIHTYTYTYTHMLPTQWSACKSLLFPVATPALQLWNIPRDHEGRGHRGSPLEPFGPSRSPRRVLSKSRRDGFPVDRSGCTA